MTSPMKRLLSLTFLVLLVMAAPASAYDYEPLTYDGFVDGSDATGVSSPSFNQLAKVGFDQATGTLYGTTSEGVGRVYKFDAATRQSEPFAELAPNSVFPQLTYDGAGFTVDNSGTETQSLIYAFEQSGPVNIYRPGGAEKTDVEIDAHGISCGAEVGPDGHLWIAFFYIGLKEFLPSGAPTGKKITPDPGPVYNVPEMCDFAIDSQYNFYVPEDFNGGYVKKYDSNGDLLYRLGGGAAKTVVVNRKDDSVYVDDQSVIEKYSSTGSLLDEFGKPEPSGAPCPTVVEEAGECYNGLYGSGGLAVDESSGAVYVANRNFPERIDIFTPTGPPAVAADVDTDFPVPTPTTALLRGTLNPDGVATTSCKFEWGPGSGGLENEVPCIEGDVFSGSGDQSVSGEITGLSLGSIYHGRIVVENANGLVSYGLDRYFTAQGKPIFGKAYVNGLNTDGARLNAEISPNQGPTTYLFEYGTDTNYGTKVPIAAVALSPGGLRTVSQNLQGLTPGTEYHYRVVATNLAGVSTGADHVFHTFPRESFVDGCVNALSRQQTGAASLPDCRSYELASAPDTGGYNVESDLVPGQQPIEGPTADGRLLYGIHDGGIPNSGNPTNYGLDPYLATRTDDGWTTKYVGVPANGTPSTAPFASTLLAADEGFEAFAFGGAEICEPCFADGTGGIPIRGRDSKLVQGMAGSLSPVAGAKPDGLIKASISADGSHLVFGSTSQFEPDGNDNTGDVSIYVRDLISGTTQVVSKTPEGTNLPCLQGAGACHSPGDGDGIAELAISADGSRVVVAQRVSTDSAGNQYWHPYLHVGSDPETIDLAPGTTSGVLFDGMTSDGSMVYLTTRDQLSDDDTDSSADIYVDRIEGDTVTPELVSVVGGGPSNSDACTPVADWNTVSGGPNCDAVAFAGGAGLASQSGTFYFASPELLDGADGEENQANLYVVEDSEVPRFVATMDTSVGKPGTPPPSRPVAKPEFISGLSGPESLAVNQLTGDVYVAESDIGVVSRYTSAGTPHPFTAGPGALTNRLPGQNLGGTGENGLGVDGHVGSPFEGHLYVTSNSSTVRVYADSGALVGTINGFGEACGVAVDQANGDLYVADYYSGLWRLQPISNSKPNFDENYERTQIQTRAAAPGVASLSPCQVAADAGDVFGSGWNEGPLLSYQSSQFAASPGPEIYGPVVALKSTTATLDPSTNELLVNVGGSIDVFGPSNQPEETLAKGEITGSRGIAVNAANHHIYAVSGSSVVELDYIVHAYEPIDNPAVAHGVRESGVRQLGDFQVSPDGRFAAFTSATQITSFDSFNHLEVYRYDTEDGSIVCASCAPTNSQATKDALLPQHGNALTSDGRVFFSSTEPLVLRDTNGNKDAYEWKDGDVYLISSGTSPFDSSMLSVTASGKDAYFFTRERMAPEDLNGSVMRIYDAREDGGFFHIPDPPQCRASDECHGPGSQAPAPAGVGSRGGTEGNLTTPPKRRCKPGFVRKGGKCKRKHRKHKKRGGRR